MWFPKIGRGVAKSGRITKKGIPFLCSIIPGRRPIWRYPLQDNTLSSSLSLSLWPQIISRSWNHLSKSGHPPSSKQLADEIASRLAISPQVALGLIEGFDSLLKFATSEWDSSSDVVDQERLSIKVALASARPILEARLQDRLDHLDLTYPQARCQGCGREPLSQGRRTRSWDSTLGELDLERRYFWCKDCQSGLSPAQEKVGLPESDFTPAFEEVTSLMATTIPHQLAVTVLHQLLGVEVSPKAAKSITSRRGAEVVEQIEKEAQELDKYERDWQTRPPVGPDPNSSAPLEVAYLEIDGVSVPVRKEVERKEIEDSVQGGKGRKYEVRGREVKNAVLYEASSCAEESESRGCILEKKYVSHLGDWKKFALLVWVEILLLGYDRAKLLVVLSDGAEWIRSLVMLLPIEVMLILDLYHVKKKIWEVGVAVYGEGSQQAVEWSEEQCKRVEEGKAEEVIEGLKFLKKSKRRAREKIAGLERYLENNLDRMDYPGYKAAGLRVGSGAVESTNYHVTGARLKLQGMRWSEEGASQMAKLRADLFNGKWQERTKQTLKAS